MLKDGAGRFLVIVLLVGLVILSCAPSVKDVTANTVDEVGSTVATPMASVKEAVSHVDATGETAEVDFSKENQNLPPEGQVARPLPSEGPSVQTKTIVIDPGHGGSEIGAANVLADGTVIREKDINLKIAFKLRDLLESKGYQVILTRETDSRASGVDEEILLGYSRTRADLQARVDIANKAQAGLFISIHNNGSTDPQQSGSEVWYSKDRPFAERNLALAQLVQESLVRNIRATGYNIRDRGIRDDSNFRIFQSRSFNLFVLGPPRTQPTPTRATQMPGILGETLFVTNPREAALLARDEVLDAIAQGYYEGIVRYFERLSDS